jgi:hypothetical protein
METPKIVLEGMLSRDVGFSVRVQGTFGIREYDRLLALLRLMQEWMREDEAAKAGVEVVQPTSQPQATEPCPDPRQTSA